MSRTSFRIMGGFTLFTATLSLLAGLYALAGYSPRLSPAGAHLVFVARLATWVALLAVIGFGLLFLRKWAALVFSAATIYLAIESAREGVTGAVHPSPGVWYWICFVYALALICPAILTVRYWRDLSWGTKRTATSTSEKG